MGLEDYKDLVAASAMICTMGHMLSGTLICKDIYKKGTTKGVDPFPFVGGIGMCLLMLGYALILQDYTMIKINFFGILTNISYMNYSLYNLLMKTQAFKDSILLIGISFLFKIYNIPLTEIIVLLAKVVAFVLVIFTYTQFESKTNLEFRYGFLVTILMMLLIASPLIHLVEIIKTQSTEILPFPLIFMGTIVFFNWLLYGLIIKNNFIIFQNAVGFMLSAAQLSLFVIYPSKPKQDEKSD